MILLQRARGRPAARVRRPGRPAPGEAFATDTYELANFAHLAETLSFSRTSRERNVSPSALSRQIKRLEQELGGALFVRDNRRVELTPAGEALREWASGALHALADVRARVGGENPPGEVALYGSVTACYAILPSIIERFRRRFPAIHVKLETGDEALAIQRVRDEQVDIAVAALPDRLAAGLEFRTITATPLVFVAPGIPCAVSELCNRRPIPWRDVPMILSERGLARLRVDAWFRARRISPSIYARVSGNEAILAMVGLGCGVGVVPALVLERSPLTSAVRTLDVEPALAPYAVGLCVHRRRLALPHIRAFWETAAG